MSDLDDNQVEDDPPFIGRFEIDDEGEFYADVYGKEEDTASVTWDFGELFDALAIDPNDKDFLLDQITVDMDADGSSFDPGDPDIRGGYDRDEVKEFLDDTGWWGIADIFYDEIADEYYIDINYDDGA